MSILNKIKSYFIKNETKVELELEAAEIKKGFAFLHPKASPDVTYRVRANEVDIFLKNRKALTDEDVVIIPTGSKSSQKSPQKAIQESPNQKHAKQQKCDYERAFDFTMFKKRKFSMSLYPDEYEMLINTIREGKYRRAEFVLACITSASKTNVERAHKKLVKLHNEKAHEEKTLRENQTINIAE